MRFEVVLSVSEQRRRAMRQPAAQQGRHEINESISGLSLFNLQTCCPAPQLLGTSRPAEEQDWGQFFPPSQLITCRATNGERVSFSSHLLRRWCRFWTLRSQTNQLRQLRLRRQRDSVYLLHVVQRQRPVGCQSDVAFEWTFCEASSKELVCSFSIITYLMGLDELEILDWSVKGFINCHVMVAVKWASSTDGVLS